MKIAYLSLDAGVPVTGTSGSSIHIRNIVGALRGLGHEVQIFTGAPVTGHPDGVTGLELDGFGAELSRLVKLEDGLPSHLDKEWRTVLMAERAQRQLAEAFDRFEPDAIVERYSLFGYAGVELASRLQIPLVLEVNAPLCLEQERYRTLALRRAAPAIEAQVLNGSDSVLVVSEALGDYARELGVDPGRLTVLPNGVDPSRFRPDVSGGTVRAANGLGTDPVVGFVGSLKPWHDLGTLIEATRVLAARGENTRLLVVGDGPGRSESDDRIIYTGAVAHDEVPAHLAAMSVIAVPYPQEGETYFSPLKLYEAMAMGKPIVGARIGQVASCIEDGVSGVLYEPGDPESLADAVTDILNRPDRGNSLGREARDWVLDGHTWDDNARCIQGLIESHRQGRNA